jgi:hypothetical protein
MVQSLFPSLLHINYRICSRVFETKFHHPTAKLSQLSSAQLIQGSLQTRVHGQLPMAMFKNNQLYHCRCFHLKPSLEQMTEEDELVQA